MAVTSNTGPHPGWWPAGAASAAMSYLYTPPLTPPSLSLVPIAANHGEVHFNLSGMNPVEALISEKLVFLAPSSNCNVSVRVYSSSDKSRLLREGRIEVTETDRPEWVEFKVSTTPRQHNSRTLFILYIELSAENNEGTVPSIADLHPLLVVFTQNNHTLPSVKEPKLQIREDATVQKRQENQPLLDRLAGLPCQRQEHLISYPNLGWPDLNEVEVYHPDQGLPFSFCYGHCSSVEDLNVHNTTNHALYLELANKGKERATPLPCCAPAELMPVLIIFRNKSIPNSAPELKLEPDMNIDRCICS